ncbi:serine/threonine-protein kinase [Rhodococcus sp. UNC363MFTsu5.1]|uniref:serine/threonine-protein kinase n=1 Tax=Rhodococcus sp. UNC363MFTsu5.1 TaxID=1449069 RepID=UPI000690E9A3|nr:serine/threonine-protein kinase [Rhodococcus sp. UNC363MFTsu5.1]
MDGTSFGRYRLQELIGEGGMGKVHKAYDTLTDRIVALKVLHEHTAADPEFRERFRREAHAAARLSEPHVVPIHHYGEIEGRLYLDMRLIEGADLKTLLALHGPMPPAVAVSVVEQVAAALDAAHAAGLVHRDVKPSNVLVSARDFVYLIDFGIARSAQDKGLTSTGATIGTFHYMAPERFTTGQGDARSDVYALACVLHECLTGSYPYPGDSLEQQISGHLTAAPPRPSQVRPGVPAGFDQVIAQGMAKSPDDRYFTPGGLAAAAERALTTEPRPNAATTVVIGAGTARTELIGSQRQPRSLPTAMLHQGMDTSAQPGGDAEASAPTRVRRASTKRKACLLAAAVAVAAAGAVAVGYAPVDAPPPTTPANARPADALEPVRPPTWSATHTPAPPSAPASPRPTNPTRQSDPVPAPGGLPTSASPDDPYFDDPYYADPHSDSYYPE